MHLSLLDVSANRKKMWRQKVDNCKMEPVKEPNKRTLTHENGYTLRTYERRAEQYFLTLESHETLLGLDSSVACNIVFAGELIESVYFGTNLDITEMEKETFVDLVTERAMGSWNQLLRMDKTFTSLVNCTGKPVMEFNGTKEGILGIHYEMNVHSSKLEKILGYMATAVAHAVRP